MYKKFRSAIVSVVRVYGSRVLSFIIGLNSIFVFGIVIRVIILRVTEKVSEGGRSVSSNDNGVILDSSRLLIRSFKFKPTVGTP